MPMVSVMLIMSIGGLMGVGYEKALLLHTDGNLAVSELIATYVYKKGLTGVPDQAYFDRFYDPVISAQINYGPIGIVYEEETDASGMLVQKPVPEGMTTDELRLQNAPLGIIYLSDYAWNNVVRMEPRAQLRLERLGLVATPFVPEGVKPCPNLQFTLEELNTLSNYETNLNDYIRTNLINWLLKGGVTDAQWDAFQNDLAGKCRIDELQKVYQDAYDRFVSGN